jgi:hypothetical protein
MRRAVVKWKHINLGDNDLGRENVNEVGHMDKRKQQLV